MTTEMRAASKRSDATAPTSPAAAAGQQNRAYALDALRGFAILAMLLSGQLPFNEHALPAWMYHAQVGPPHFVWSNSAYGITWVDLVFPFFLFAMGASFPLAFARRMDAGMPKWRLALFILERGFLLGFFALYVDAIRPHELSKSPTTGTWFLGLLGFALLFPMLTRLPDKWPVSTRWGIKSAGWTGAFLFLALAKYPDGSGFKLGRSDIIIVVLANMAVFGSVAWILTRNRLLPRLGILGILLAIRLSNMPTQLGGWTSQLWDYSPAPWIYRLYYLQYLCIVIPGTIAGDLILQWIRQPTPSPDSRNWPTSRFFGIALLMFVFVLELLIGLKSRWLISTTLLTFALCGIGWWVLSKPKDETARLYKNLFLWASYWLIIGLFFEPYEGGIRKDKATVSYYFITSGLAICVLIGFSILIDVCKRRRWFQLLIDNGQNPMIAYAGINNFITPLLALTGLDAVLNGWAVTPWRGFCQGLLVTVLMALAVSLCTRFRIFWRT